MILALALEVKEKGEVSAMGANEKLKIFLPAQT
jgi:hypothetical protein